MNPETSLMHAEAEEAADAVERFLTVNDAALDRISRRLIATVPQVVVTCARGSSDHAATYGKYLIETMIGVPTASAAPSVASLFETPVKTPGTVCIAISQSGRSPDLLRSVASFREAGALVIAIVNDIASPLADMADEVLALSAGPERSVAATKSYITSLVALCALVARWKGDAALRAEIEEVPAALRRAFEAPWDEFLPSLTSARNLFVIGRGYSFAIAQEAALKLKETCGLHAEAFSSAEVRHGPMAIVGAGFPVLAFAGSDAAGDTVRLTVEDFRSREATLVLRDARSLPGSISAMPDIHPALEPILMIQTFYRLANALSIARGLHPDQPPHLKKVTETV